MAETFQFAFPSKIRAYNSNSSPPPLLKAGFTGFPWFEVCCVPNRKCFMIHTREGTLKLHVMNMATPQKKGCSCQCGRLHRRLETCVLETRQFVHLWQKKKKKFLVLAKTTKPTCVQQDYYVLFIH